MLSRPEPQSFTKFVLSVGVFLCIAAFVVPALVLREIRVLQISQKDLASYTEGAREELLHRQDVATKVRRTSPYAGGLMLISGTGLIIWALPRLRKYERSDEERSSAELDKLRSEIAPQTETEREERLEEEAAAEQLTKSASEPASEPRSPGRAPGAAEPGDPSHEVEVPANVAEDRRRELSRLDVDDFVSRARAVESQVLRRIAEVTPPFYELQPQVKVGGTSRLLLDGLLVSDIDQLPDVVIEIKLTRGAHYGVLAKRATDAALMPLRYRTVTGRATAGWIIIVYAGTEPLTAAVSERARKRVQEIDPRIHLTVVIERDLEAIEFPRSITST